MSLNPIPSSLKSSVGSKSTNAHLGGEGGSFYQHDERSGTLCSSSWISRLHLRLPSHPPGAPPPAPRTLPATAGPGPPLDVVSHNKHTISTDESRTPTSISNLNSSFVARRYFNLFERRPPGAPPRRSPPPRIVYRDGGDRSVSGFGPFRVRSRNAALPRGGEGSLGGHDAGGERAIGRGDYGYGGGCFPLFSRMTRPGEGLDGERGVLGSRVGRQLGCVRPEEQLDQGNAFFPSRRAADVHDQIKVSPFFQYRPSLNLGHSIGRSKGIIDDRVDGGSTKILEHRSQMRPTSNENWRWPLPTSYVPSKQVIDDIPSWRPYEGHLSVDPLHASASVQHVARSRGTYDGTDEAAPSRTSYDPHVLHQNMAINRPERTPVYMNQPEETLSLWNMGRFKRRNTGSFVSPTIGSTSNCSMKRSSKFDDSLPPKFRKLGDED